jgi:hypothetical protein
VGGSSKLAAFIRAMAAAPARAGQSASRIPQYEGENMADNWRGKLITAGVARAPNRAMLRAVDFKDGDFDKPIVGVISSASAAMCRYSATSSLRASM